MFDYAAKETGYGWCVVGFSFLLHVIVCGIAYSCGVIHLIFRAYFNEPSHFVTSWIGTTLLAMTVLAGIPGTLLTYKLGYRLTVIIGGILAVAGMTVSGFCTEFWQVLLSFGALTGLGFGLTLAPSVMIVESYFHVKRTLATSCVYAGSSVGLIFVPLVVYHLEDRFAWKGMALILGGLCMKLLVCGAAYRTPERKTPKPRRRRSLLRIFECGLFRSGAFVAVLLSNVLWSFGSLVVYTYLPSYAIRAGHSPEGATVLIGVVGLAGAVCRPMFQLFGHSAKLDHASVLLCSVGLAAILTGLHPQMMTHAAGRVGYAVVFGLHAGFMTTLVALLAGDLVGAEYLAWGRGFITIAVAVGVTAAGPLAGWLLDVTDDYEIIFYLAGSSMLLSSCIMSITNMKRCYFRPTADWCDSDSESSASSSNKQAFAAYAEEYMLSKALVHSEVFIAEVTPTPGKSSPEPSDEVDPPHSDVIWNASHVTNVAGSELTFPHLDFVLGPETDV